MYHVYSLTALWLIPWKLVFSVFSLNVKGILSFYYSWEAVSQTSYHEASIQTCWEELWSYIQGNVIWLWKSFPEKLIQRYFADSLSLQAHDQNSLSMNDIKVHTLLFPAAVVNITASRQRIVLTCLKAGQCRQTLSLVYKSLNSKYSSSK